jgi:hypothetical protein
VCAGVIIGDAIGGPLGAAIGAGLSTPLEILVETQIAGIITDPRIRAEFEEATIGRYIYETIRNCVVAGAAAYVAEFLSAHLNAIDPRDLENTLVMIGIALAPSISNTSISAMLTKYVAPALCVCVCVCVCPLLLTDVAQGSSMP